MTKVYILQGSVRSFTGEDYYRIADVFLNKEKAEEKVEELVENRGGEYELEEWEAED
jgi:hypothetical protein